jgi:hypothetical protein
VRRAVLLYSLSAYEIHLAEQTLRFMSTPILYTKIYNISATVNSNSLIIARYNVQVNQFIRLST